MIRLQFSVLAVLLAACAISAEEIENPLKNAKVGDWVEYKMSNKMGGTSMESTMKQTVTKKTDTEVTLEIEMKMANMNMPKQSVVIKLDQKYDPMKADPNAEVKQLGTGEEKLTIGDKTYDTKWVEAEVTSKQMQGMKVKSKAWTSTEVPVTGVVKTVGEIQGMGTMTQELIGSGRGK